MTTLLKPDNGYITIDGMNVLEQSLKVQKEFSLTGQFAAVDEVLTGRENLVLIAKLRHMKNYTEKVDEAVNGIRSARSGGSTDASVLWRNAA